MLDTKVLAAALVSLAATSIAMNGGASMSMEDGINLDSIKDMEITPRTVGAFTGLVEQPTPDKAVKASLNYNKSLPEDLKLRSATVEASNLTSLDTGESSISSNGPISVYGFEGTVTLDRPVNLDGKASGAVSNGVNISESFEIEQEVETDNLKLSRVKASRFELASVRGDISSGSTSAKVSGGKLSMSAFAGNMTFDLTKDSLELNGEVASLTAGSFSLD